MISISGEEMSYVLEKILSDVHQHLSDCLIYGEVQVPKAVDCSGFSQSVYYLNGIILLRDASLQALHGLNVDISSGYGQLRPGDLLFFGTKENSKLHVTHVAVYKGDREYINSSGRVMINSLDSTRSNYNGYRVNSLLSAKRIIGVNDDPGIVSI